jgi:transcriptional regulator with XRE-family HTH domain
MKYLEMSNDGILQDLSERLRALRLRADLSQEALAEASGVSFNTVRNAEEGRNISLDTLISLLRALQALPALEGLLPQPGLSPVDLARRAGKPRQRASGKRSGERADWQW